MNFDTKLQRVQTIFLSFKNDSNNRYIEEYHSISMSSCQLLEFASNKFANIKVLLILIIDILLCNLSEQNLLKFMGKLNGRFLLISHSIPGSYLISSTVQSSPINSRSFQFIYPSLVSLYIVTATAVTRLLKSSKNNYTEM